MMRHHDAPQTRMRRKKAPNRPCGERKVSKY
jgi:hypothetical protein